jgi:hypothetical protein
MNTKVGTSFLFRNALFSLSGQFEEQSDSSISPKPNEKNDKISSASSSGRGFNPSRKRSDNLLIVGLGNPGDEYANSRHNVGFMVLDELAARTKTELKFATKYTAEYGATVIGNKNIGLLKPMSYINNSGKPLTKIMERFNLTASEIIVVCDDIALDFGVLRLREKGSHGGEMPVCLSVQ